MMDLSAQQKRRPAATYGKFFGNRRAVATAFETGIDLPRYEEDSGSPGRAESPSLELAGPVPSTSKQPSTSGSKDVSHHKNNKHGLERANSTSKLEIADQTVFDVPSSDEDIPKLKPTVRRALSSSQKRLGKSRLEENRTPSTGGCGRYPADKEGFKAQRPMVALGQTAKTQTKVIKRTLTGRSEGRFAGDNNMLSLKALISEPKITSRILGPANTPLGQSSAEVTARVTQIVTGEKANLEESKALAKVKADEVPKVEQNGLAVPIPKSQEGPVAKKPSAQVDVPVQQRRPRKYRDPKPTQIISEREPTIERKTSFLTRPKDSSGAIGSRKTPTGPLPTSLTDIGSLYIPPSAVEVEKPQKGDVTSSTGGTKSTEETTLWDDIMGGIEEEHWFPRKPKRSRDSEGSEEVLEKGPTPPRRRRLIDSLEVDQSIDQPKQGVEEEMDVDVDSQTSDHIPSLQSQLSLDLQENDDLEDAAQTFQRGVGAMQNAPVYPQRNTRVTYARQRSFLTEEVKAGGDPFADPLLLPVRDLGRGLRKVPIVEEDDEDTTPGMMKSLHELREAGVNTRFLDSVEGYFEDIERGVSLGQKRVGYIELATKLCDRTFLQKFRANNFERRLLKDLGKQDDEIVRFVLSFIVWILLEGETSPQLLQVIHKRGILLLLDKMLVSNRDMKFVVKDKKINMTRAAQSLLLEFCDVIKGSKIFGGKAPKSLSPQILALAVLDSVLKSLRRAGFMGPCLSILILQKLVKVLEPFQDSVDIEKRKQVDPLFVELPVSILESHSIGNEDVLIPQEELEILANIIPGVMQLEGDGFKPIQLLILRLHINLTNRRPDICGIFGKSTVISTVVARTQSTFHALSGPLGEEDRLIQLDMLVLSLALMINFAEMSDSARSSFVEGSFENSQLSILLNLFLGRMERAAEAESMEESQSNVAFGYLSILLGNLCQNHTVRNVLRSKMPKGSLQPLMFAVQEFVSHNQRVDEERRQITGGEGENWHRGFTERLEEVAARLRALEDKT